MMAFRLSIPRLAKRLGLFTCDIGRPGDTVSSNPWNQSTVDPDVEPYLTAIPCYAWPQAGQGEIVNAIGVPVIVPVIVVVDKAIDVTEADVITSVKRKDGTVVYANLNVLKVDGQDTHLRLTCEGGRGGR